MASPAVLEYLNAAERTQALRKAAINKHLRATLSQGEIQVYYHAALAAYVAAWEAYVSNLARAFYDVISSTLNPGSQAIYAIAQQSAERALERFNTPNGKTPALFSFNAPGTTPSMTGNGVGVE